MDMKMISLLKLTMASALLAVQFILPTGGQASPVLSSRAVSNSAPYLSGEILISGLDNVKHLPSVAYNSKRNEYLVVWHTEWTIGTRDIRAQRVSPAGKLLGSEFTVYENPTRDAAQPSVAYDPVNDRYLVTFVYDSFGDGSDWDLYGRLIPWNGPSASMAAFPIITWSTSQWNPKVVYAGGIQQEFFVVWNNTYTAGTPPAYVSGKRMRPDGTFPSSGSDLTLSDMSINYVNPDVSYNLARNEYLVVWEKVTSLSNHDIWGVRITGNAVQLGGGPFGIAGWPDSEEIPAVAACNMANQYLVTWQSDQQSAGSINYAIYARYINGDGSVAGVHLVDDTTSPEIHADVACINGGRQYFIAWQTRYVTGYYGVWARLAFPDESFQDSFGLVQPGASADRTYPSIAGGNSNYLVAWEHERAGTSYQDIRGRVVTPSMIFLPLVIR
jgi:hypothetical protein